MIRGEELIMYWFMTRTCALVLAIPSAGTAYSQDYPTRPVRIVTSTPGGGNDFLARIIAPALGAALGQQVIVDNRTSRFVGGIVARATPDGYTLALGGGTMQFNPITDESDYNVITDFAPISLLAHAPLVLVVNPALKVNTVQELVALARAKPLLYGSGSAGNSIHIAGEMFATAAGVKVKRVPYKSTGPALIALLANEVHLMFATTGGAIPHVKEGRLKALGVTSAKPFSLTPGVPSLASQGLKDYDIDAIDFILAPLKTPPPLIRKLHAYIVQIMNQPDVKEKLAAGGNEAQTSTPDELMAKLKADDAMRRQQLTRMGIAVRK
jgi:tripartite-type tricarboxylate transporter receptor subunit TctC